MRWNLNEFLICNSSYIYNCAQDYREAAAFAFAKKPVLHEECAMLKFGDFYLFSLVWQNVHKGHWKDPFPLWLSFNVSDLQHRRNKQTNKCPYTHRTFTDSMNSIQNQQNCTDAMGTLQVFWQLKASSVNIWVCVSEQNKILQTKSNCIQREQSSYSWIQKPTKAIHTTAFQESPHNKSLTFFHPWTDLQQQVTPLSKPFILVNCVNHKHLMCQLMAVKLLLMNCMAGQEKS